MRYLNLTPDFTPFGYNKFSEITFEAFTFKGGEPHIKLLTNIGNGLGRKDNNVIISHRVQSFNDLGLLVLAVDALKRTGFTEISLLIPYFPGARQDRLMVRGEGFTSAVYVRAISAMKFHTIYSYDLHSDVVGGMFAVLEDHFIDIPNHSFVSDALMDIEPDENLDSILGIVSPDAGSNKKIKDLRMSLTSSEDILPIIKCDKTRNVATGEITGFEVYTDLACSDLVIIDDICDGGGTFIGLAQELRKKYKGNFHLIITHGIFSKGLHELAKIFETIHCTNSFDPLKYHEGVVPRALKIHKINLTI